MKQYGIIYEDNDQMNEFIKFRNINNNSNILVQVFTGIVNIDYINNLIDEIKALLPQAKIIGTTTAGEIYEGKSYSNTTVISFSIFYNTEIDISHFEIYNEFDSGVKIAKQLIKNDTQIIILFSNGLLSNGWDILKGIESIDNKIIVAGGQAGDNGYFKEAFVFTNEGILKNGVVAASLSSKNLKIVRELNFSWSSIGKQMTITKAEGNRVFTIDNQKAIDIYKKYLGEEVVNSLPISATEFPIVIKKDNIDIARVAYKCYDDGSIAFLGNVDTGDIIQFGYGNVSNIKNTAKNIEKKLNANSKIEGVLLYSCSVRKAFMQEKINLDTEFFRNIAPSYGFFTYGEFFSGEKTNQMLNLTMTVVGLTEGNSTTNHQNYSSNKNPVGEKSFFEDKDIGIINVFSNLVNQVTKELEESNKNLEKQYAVMEKMNSVIKSIANIDSKILSSQKVGNVFQDILEKALEVLPKGKIGSIVVLENDKLYYKATKGYKVDLVGKISHSIEKILFLYNENLLSNENLFEPLIINKLEKNLFNDHNDFNLWTTALSDNPYEMLTCGIGVENRVVGFVDIFNTNIECSFNEEDKKLLKYICYDIAIAFQNVELIENLLYMTNYDKLTGIYNRQYFEKVFDETIEISIKSNKPFALCILDLNYFKSINDTYGHHTGDLALIHFANILKKELRNSDILARIGGDEFAIICSDIKNENMCDLLYRISTVLKKNKLVSDKYEIELSFAYGCSQYPNEASDVFELIKLADKRMYELKRKIKERL